MDKSKEIGMRECAWRASWYPGLPRKLGQYVDRDTLPIGFDTYQTESYKTSAPQADDMGLAVLTLGLTGEAGEVADLVKKYLRHGKSLPTAIIRDELGDVLWYVTMLAFHFGISLSSVAENNIKKLQHRYPDGFVEGGGNRDAS